MTLLGLIHFNVLSTSGPTLFGSTVLPEVIYFLTDALVLFVLVQLGFAFAHLVLRLRGKSTTSS